MKAFRYRILDCCFFRAAPLACLRSFSSFYTLLCLCNRRSIYSRIFSRLLRRRGYAISLLRKVIKLMMTVQPARDGPGRM
jgi:hypothetical protein